jgi:VIT1/CCC1 family predicted Fe2+/Mn2+ transporter
MDTLYHREEHFQGGDTVKDIVIGMSDGLTVPFALAAGISGAISAAHIVVTAGFAEIAAGSIAMGLGGYLAARSEVDHYRSEPAREEAEIREKPEVEAEEVASFFREYGLTEAEYNPVVEGLRTKRKAWRDFMRRFELGLEEPEPKRALQSAITIVLSYVAGGIVPLAPYILFHDIKTAFYFSVVFMLAAPAVFGFVRGKFTGVLMIKSALQTVLVGGLAAAVAYGLARIIS